MIFDVITREDIFAPESCGFTQCHASTVCPLPDGSVAAAWFGGEREGAPDVSVWFSRRHAHGWEPPRKIACHTGTPCWNPVLHCLGADLLLFYKGGAEIPSWRTFLRCSADNGTHWSEPAELVPGDTGGRGPVKNKCIVLADGALLAPASREDGYWRCFADRSEDGGRRWQRSEDVPCDIPHETGRGVIQPTLWQSADGTVHMLMRSSEGALYRSDSADAGRSWSPAVRTGLPNNNCGVDLARLADGRLVLAYNPVAGNWGPRSPMALTISADNGAHWSEPWVLEHIPCDKNVTWAEFSYPALTASGDRLLLTYTRKRQTIAFWELRAH